MTTDVPTLTNAFQPYVSPDKFPLLTLVFMVIGLYLGINFFISEVSATKEKRNLVTELVTALIASVFLGIGTLFLMLWVGIYV